MSVDRNVAVVNTGYRLAPHLVAVDITLATGTETITAANVGLRRIKGFSAGVWGATTGIGFSVQTTTTFSTSGVTSLVLEAVEDDGTLGVSEKVTVLLWGDK